MLNPLHQFVCDKCGQIINSPEEGYVEWESDYDSVTGKEKQWGFKIVHHKPHSPFSNTKAGCYHYEDSLYRSDLPLTDFVGKSGMAEILSFLDVGPYHQPNYAGPSVTDMREFVEFVRRLTIPYYEEARLYWREAQSDGYFDEANEIWVYSPDKLKNLVEKYKQ